MKERWSLLAVLIVAASDSPLAQIPLPRPPPPPEIGIQLTTSSAQSAFPVGTAIRLNAEGIGATSNLAQTTFYQELPGPSWFIHFEKMLGTATGQPLTLTLTNFDPGFFALFARGTNDSGAIIESERLTFTVYTPFSVRSIAPTNGGVEVIVNAPDASPASYWVETSTNLVDWTPSLSSSWRYETNGTFRLLDQGRTGPTFYRGSVSYAVLVTTTAK